MPPDLFGQEAAAPMRRWVPQDYVDEITPRPRERADDWIVTLPGDAYALAPIDEGETPERFLHAGDRVLFDWTESHGEADFTVEADGTWSVDRRPPEDVTHIYVIGDVETLAYGVDGPAALAEFAANMIENGAGAGTERIAYYTWSDPAVEFEFRAGAFHPVETNQPQGVPTHG